MNEFPCLRNQPALSNLKGVLIALIFAIAVCSKSDGLGRGHIFQDLQGTSCYNKPVVRLSS